MYNTTLKNNKCIQVPLTTLMLWAAFSFNISNASDAHPNIDEPVQTLPVSTYDVEFNMLDLDKNGSISVDESNKEHELARSYHSIDSNKDGDLSKREYQIYYQHRYGSLPNTRPLTHLSTQDKKNSFKKYDLDGDGMLSIEEYSNVVGLGSDGIPDNNQRKPSGAAHDQNEMDPDPK